MNACEGKVHGFVHPEADPSEQVRPTGSALALMNYIMPPFVVDKSLQKTNRHGSIEYFPSLNDENCFCISYQDEDTRPKWRKIFDTLFLRKFQIGECEVMAVLLDKNSKLSMGGLYYPMKPAVLDEDGVPRRRARNVYRQVLGAVEVFVSLRIGTRGKSANSWIYVIEFNGEVWRVNVTYEQWGV